MATKMILDQLIAIVMLMFEKMLIEEEDPSLLNAFRQSNQIAVEVTHHHYFAHDHDDDVYFAVMIGIIMRQEDKQQETQEPIS